jgi:hypothetical protein
VVAGRRRERRAAGQRLRWSRHRLLIAPRRRARDMPPSAAASLPAPQRLGEQAQAGVARGQSSQPHCESSTSRAAQCRLRWRRARQPRGRPGHAVFAR